MGSIFDGLTGILSDVFGGHVAYQPSSGLSRDIQSMFREAPIEIEGADGQIVRIEAPTWRVRRNLAPEVQRGDLLVLIDGRAFRVMVVHKTASPASDAFLICECQEADVT